MRRCGLRPVAASLRRSGSIDRLAMLRFHASGRMPTIRSASVSRSDWVEGSLANIQPSERLQRTRVSSQSVVEHIIDRNDGTSPSLCPGSHDACEEVRRFAKANNSSENVRSGSEMMTPSFRYPTTSTQGQEAHGTHSC